MTKILEVCVDSLASARQAIAADADRLELCSALVVGGLTPYTALLQQIREESAVPIRCLIRCRPGDFLYTAEELELMRRQIQELRDAGASGFVIGCLTPEGTLDQEALKPLISTCGDCGITLHRCIDVSANPEQAYRDAMALGFDTVLTSGGAAAAVSGINILRRLISLRDEFHGPEVLIGSGVNASVITHFRRELPAAQAFHMSGKVEVESGMRFRRDGVPMGLPGLDEWHIQQTSAEAVRAARAALDN